MHFVPRQTLLVELFHEWIGVEVFHIPNSGFTPKSLEEHHRANHGWYTGGIAYALHTCLLVSFLVLAVVIYIIGVLFAIFETTDAASDGGFTIIVLT